MNKKFIFMITTMSLLLVISFTGCMDVEVPKDILQFSISRFEVEPAVITQGETANLSWTIFGGKSAHIDNGIGNVSLMGSRVIIPDETTTYTLTVVNATTTLTATTQIIVNEYTEPNETPTLSMNIYSKDSTSGTIVWLVAGVEGGPIEDDSIIMVLLDEYEIVDYDATITFYDYDYNDYVNPGDTFTVVASQDGYYAFRISDTTAGDILFKSVLVHYEMIFSTLSMNIYSRDDAANQTIWLVSGIEGPAIEDGTYEVALLAANGSVDAGATFVKNEVTGAGYLNAGDTFTVTASADGYYVFMITDISSGGTIYKSTSTKY